MRFNPFTKQIYSFLFTKLSGLKEALPKDEKERVHYLIERCKNYDTDPEMDLECYIKMNGVILITIWLSNHDYDSSCDIFALENIVREYEKDETVNEFFPPGINYESSYQMLIRNYVEKDEYPTSLIDNMLEKYREFLGKNEQVAYEDEYLNYEFMKGNFLNLNNRSNTILNAPKGEFSDCYACIVNRLIRINIVKNDFEAARKLINKVFDEKLTCDKIPKRTYIQKLLTDYKSEGKSDLKEKKAFKNLEKNSSEIWEATFLLEYCFLTKNIELGNQVLEQFKDIITACRTPEKVAYCAVAFKITGDKEYYRMGVELADKFDKRNDNSFYSKMFDN